MSAQPTEADLLAQQQAAQQQLPPQQQPSPHPSAAPLQIDPLHE